MLFKLRSPRASQLLWRSHRSGAILRFSDLRRHLESTHSSGKQPHILIFHPSTFNANYISDSYRPTLLRWTSKNQVLQLCLNHLHHTRCIFEDHHRKLCATEKTLPIELDSNA